MSYTMYTPLNVWLDPASVTDVVAYIQTYLSENTIYSETEIETIIHDYLIAHPELIGGVQSVNGKTGTVVLSASDINTENNVTIESVLASLSSQISSIAASVATNTSNITSLTGRMTTAETDLTNLKSNIEYMAETQLNLETFKIYKVNNGVLDVLEAVMYGTYKSTIVNVEAGEVVLYSGRVYNYNNQYSLIAVDNDNTVLGYELGYTTDNTITDYEYTIPTGSTKLIIQSYIADPVLKKLAPYDLSKINSISDGINQVIDAVIPEYYNNGNYLENKINTINNNSSLHGIKFVFITDPHFKYNQLHSLALLQNIKSKTSINCIICGGDFVQAYGGENDISYARNIAFKYSKQLYPDWFCLRGNHDFTIRTSSSDTSGITKPDSYSIDVVLRPISNWRYEQPTPTVSFLNDTMHLYANYCWVLTDEIEKIKIIGFCDMSSTNTEKSFGIANTITNAYARYFAQLLEATDGYNVIVATHAPITDQLNGGYNTALTNIINAYNSKTSVSFGSYTVDFSSNTGVLICCISGHNHTDQSATVDGVLHINTTCDALYQDDGYNRTAGTIYEQAFDVFNIDTPKRTIKITRIGAGNDRQFTY